ncbi:MAG: hypothetical protein WC747_02445 [Candidatus Babeliales bacterium]|jgi:hypothetical protein
MNKKNFKFFALFSFLVFSSANSYSMFRATRPQISTLPFIALRNCSTSPEKPQETAQASETPKKTNETKRSETRMHQEDMDEIKSHIEDNGVNYFLIFCIGLITGGAARSHK